jgi:acyl phosphate:glycerol-3-phosphate acyltransferase
MRSLPEMENYYPYLSLILFYVIGSIPFGLVIVKLVTGKDIRKVESGRTGGTNAMRAAGFWAGLSTALLDGVKAAATVWLARLLFPIQADPGYVWLHVLAPLAAILGHNYSIFLLGRDENGRLRIKGGAGGAPCVGGSVGLWAPSMLIILPAGAAILFGLGYASIATMSVAFLSTLVFAYLALIGVSPWQYSLYGMAALALLAWSLRPNIKRLIEGKERLIGWRARRKQKRQEQQGQS